MFKVLACIYIFLGCLYIFYFSYIRRGAAIGGEVRRRPYAGRVVRPQSMGPITAAMRGQLRRLALSDARTLRDTAAALNEFRAATPPALKPQ